MRRLGHRNQMLRHPLRISHSAATQIGSEAFAHHIAVRVQAAQILPEYQPGVGRIEALGGQLHNGIFGLSDDIAGLIGEGVNPHKHL